MRKALILFLVSVTAAYAVQEKTNNAGVAFERLVNSDAEPQNWMHYWGNYQGTHYSALKEITPANVSHLETKWSVKLADMRSLETEPLVVDGIMYASGQPGAVVALDARTGKEIWRYAHERKVTNPREINPFNRGVAVLDNRVFVGTLDAAIAAIDARTGTQLWESQVADSLLGYSITSAPLALKDKVIVGVSGGEFGARGFIDAYDAATGKRLWRWYSVPEPADFGGDTWAGESWKTGGAPTWLTGSYDAATNTLIWAIGNPGAQMDRSIRGNGDNLFSDSVVALDPDTGKRKWHYQFTPNDGHDWDSVQDMMLVDRMWHGQSRKLLLHADRNGFFYVLDRTDGKFLAATAFVYQNWNSGFDTNGRPAQIAGSNSSSEGSFLVYPSLVGGTNFQAPSYSPATGWFYLEYAESGQQYISAPAEYVAGTQYIGRGRGAAPPQRGPNDPTPSAGIKAIDPENGKTMWDVKLGRGSLNDGVLATAGGVLFATSVEGNLLALDAGSGKELWRYHGSDTMRASPMSFAVDGRQYIAVVFNDTLYCFGL